MRNRRYMGAAAAICALVYADATTATESRRKVGAWDLRTERDRFSDETNVIATTRRGPMFLAVRCLQGERSIAIGDTSFAEAPFRPEQKLTVMLRFDDGAIERFRGVALNQRVLQLLDSGSFVPRVADTKEVAARLTTEAGASFDFVFPTNGGGAVVSAIRRVCP